MTDKDSNGGSPSDGVGCVLSSALGLVGLVSLFALGPMDLCRTVYNQVIGDMPIVKRKLVDYVREDMSRYVGSNIDYETLGIDENAEDFDETKAKKMINEARKKSIELKLSQELCAPIGEDGKVDYNQASTTTLYDAAEDHAKNWWQRWVWTSLD